MSNLSLIKFAYNWEYPHLLLDVVYRDYPLCEIESGLNHMDYFDTILTEIPFSKAHPILGNNVVTGL